MTDQRSTATASAVYALVIGVLAVVGQWQALVVVAVVGGPLLGLLYRRAAADQARVGRPTPAAPDPGRP